MKFTPEGATIPDELIDSVNHGNAIFLCGAGVSKNVGLPLFGELTEQICDNLEINVSNEKLVQSMMDSQEYDRVINRIENSLSDGPRIVRNIVTEILSKEIDSTKLKDHVNLLQLSRDHLQNPIKVSHGIRSK